VDKRKLHLASASPRRREILDAMGLQFTFGGFDVDETRLDGESVNAMVLRLAIDKAEAAPNAMKNEQVILAADTVVALGDKVFGKPTAEQVALEMLSELSGKSHAVFDRGRCPELATGCARSFPSPLFNFGQSIRTRPPNTGKVGNPVTRQGLTRSRVRVESSSSP